MSLSPQLIALGECLAGEFSNQEQALAEPIWYVHLRLWQRPIPLFSEDSITLFAEQANIVQLDQPYRQRVIRLSVNPNGENSLQAQYYMLKDPDSFRGAGSNPALLDTLTQEQLELLPGCVLAVTQENITSNQYKFTALPIANKVCSFTYLDYKIHVALGFAATATTFLSYDKGIDPTTGKATWGAILGPYRYSKKEQYSVLSAK